MTANSVSAKAPESSLKTIAPRCTYPLGAGVVMALAVAMWAAGAPGSAIRVGARELRDLPAAVFLGAAAAAFVLYVLALWLLHRQERRLAAVFAIAAAIQLVPLAGPLLLSRDVYSYWAYGRIAEDHGADAYRVLPAHFPNDPAVRATAPAWRRTASVYGPVFTAASTGLAAVSGDSTETNAYVYRVLAACGMIGLAAVASVAAARRAFALAFVGWNPLLALQFAGGGHNDVWLALFLVGALALAARGRSLLSGASWAVAAGVKWVPLVLLPLSLLASRQTALRIALGFVVAAAVICVGSFAVFGTAWLGAVLPLTHRHSAYALPSRLGQAGLPRSLALLPFLVAVPWLVRSARRGRPRFALATLLMLCASPWLLPWYAAWVVPLAAVEEDALAWSLALALSIYLLPDRIPL
jgi:hypothetical protein